jgi:hypothetical protein
MPASLLLKFKEWTTPNVKAYVKVKGISGTLTAIDTIEPMPEDTIEPMPDSVHGMMDYPFLRKQLNDYTSTFYGPHACHRCTVLIIKQAVEQGGDEYECDSTPGSPAFYSRHEPHCYPELKIHEQYVVVTTGEIISGNEIRLFLDWTPEHPEQPRYARITYMTRPITSGYRGVERKRVWQQNIITTYLDSELRPLGSGKSQFVLGPTQEWVTLDAVREREGLNKTNW